MNHSVLKGSELGFTPELRTQKRKTYLHMNAMNGTEGEKSPLIVTTATRHASEKSELGFTPRLVTPTPLPVNAMGRNEGVNFVKPVSVDTYIFNDRHIFPWTHTHVFVVCSSTCVSRTTAKEPFSKVCERCQHDCCRVSSLPISLQRLCRLLQPVVTLKGSSP